MESSISFYSEVSDLINTLTFEHENSIWSDIFSHLQNSGFDVYPPGINIGECTSEYVVVKNDGSIRHIGLSTDDDLYLVMCYVPKQKYSSLEPLVQRIKRAMKEIEPMVLPNGYQSPSFYDDEVKAHMVSVQYKNYKKML